MSCACVGRYLEKIKKRKRHHGGGGGRKASQSYAATRVEMLAPQRLQTHGGADAPPSKIKKQNSQHLRQVLANEKAGPGDQDEDMRAKKKRKSSAAGAGSGKGQGRQEETEDRTVSPAREKKLPKADWKGLFSMKKVSSADLSGRGDSDDARGGGGGGREGGGGGGGGEAAGRKAKDSDAEEVHRKKEKKKKRAAGTGAASVAANPGAGKRAGGVGEEENVLGDACDAGGGDGSFPYDADPSDHAETPDEAYADVAPLLERLAQSLGKTKETVRIYDPYYCNGGVIRRLKRHGFLRVYNRREDFYDKVAKNATPDFDILLTNPPYSGDHPAKIVDFCCR